MSGVLHPVGPEPEQTYWVRRALVLASAVLLVALVIAIVVGGTSTGSAVSADPPPPPLTAPAPVTPTATPALTPTATPIPAETPTATGTPSASASASSSASASASPSARTSASPNPKPKRTKAAPVACSAKDLRATLTGDQRLKPEQATTFDLSLINGSGETCRIEVAPERFELKVYSGTDRIWSSDDCAGTVERIAEKVEPEDAVEWTMRWDGRRSREGCRTRPEIPRAGTYFATAQLKGAEPVQLRLILRD